MSDSDLRATREEWRSRLGFLVTVLGTMVDTGNIRCMPFMTGENSGGAFLVAYVLLLCLVVVLRLMAGMMIGRYTNYGVTGAFRGVLGSKRTQGLGLVIPIVSVALMSYYAPIIGQVSYYAGHSILIMLIQPRFQPQTLREGLVNNPTFAVGIHMMTMAGLTGALVFGTRRGIERAVEWMIPLLVVALAAASIRGITLPGGIEGVALVFAPDWGHPTRGSTWVATFSQALFSTGLGWGTTLTYGSYLSRYDDVPPGGSLFTATGNTSVDLLVMFAAFPVVFAFGFKPGAGSNLFFISMARVSPGPPGGSLWVIVSFVSFFFATFTSGLGITEAVVTTISEKTRLSRTSAMLASCDAIWLFGLPSVYSSAFLGQMDLIFGSFGLPLTTLSTIAPVAWEFGPECACALNLNHSADIYVDS